MGAEPCGPALGGGDPGAQLPRWLMAKVLRVAAGEVGDPVACVVLMEGDYGLLHGCGPCPCWAVGLLGAEGSVGPAAGPVDGGDLHGGLAGGGVVGVEDDDVASADRWIESASVDQDAFTAGAEPAGVRGEERCATAIFERFAGLVDVGAGDGTRSSDHRVVGAVGAAAA